MNHKYLQLFAFRSPVVLAAAALAACLSAPFASPLTVDLAAPALPRLSIASVADRTTGSHCYYAEDEGKIERERCLSSEELRDLSNALRQSARLSGLALAVSAAENPGDAVLQVEIQELIAAGGGIASLISLTMRTGGEGARCSASFALSFDPRDAGDEGQRRPWSIYVETIQLLALHFAAQRCARPMPEQSLSSGMMLTHDFAEARRRLPHSIDFWSCAVYRNTPYGPQCASYLRRPVPFDIDEME